MNCRNFERRTADWLSGRLSPARSREMDAHRQECLTCARAAQAESQMRDAWQALSQEAAAAPPADLWPRLALRLDTLDPAHGRARPGRLSFGWRSPRWALAALALLTLSVCRWELLSSDGLAHGLFRPGHAAPGLSGPKKTAADLSARSASSPAESWSVLGDVSSNTALVNGANDNDVDDPVGVSTDNIWTYLKADSK